MHSSRLTLRRSSNVGIISHIGMNASSYARRKFSIATLHDRCRAWKTEMAVSTLVTANAWASSITSTAAGLTPLASFTFWCQFSRNLAYRSISMFVAIQLLHWCVHLRNRCHMCTQCDIGSMLMHVVPNLRQIRHRPHTHTHTMRRYI